MGITTIGLDIAKNKFQVHCVDGSGAVIVAKSLRRSQVHEFFSSVDPCLVGIEACGSSNYWAKELTTLGHSVKLMPAIYVKAYAKSGKSDKGDAAAICEAVTRPNMRFVPIKSMEQQGILMLHRTRALLTQHIGALRSALRGHLAELGFVAPTGKVGLKAMIAQAFSCKDFPAVVRAALAPMVQLWRQLELRVAQMEKALLVWHNKNTASKLLASIPGVGFVAATAVIAAVGDMTRFSSGRQFAAWLGFVPRQYSTGGKTKLGPISKRGDRYLRSVLFMGAASLLARAKRGTTRDDEWVRGLVARRPGRIACVAIANKTARIMWAVSIRGAPYSEPTPYT